MAVLLGIKFLENWNWTVPESLELQLQVRLQPVAVWSSCSFLQFMQLDFQTLVYRPHLSCSLYFIFEYVTAIVQSCWSFNIPPVERGIPSDLSPTHKVMIELNGVKLQWPCWDIDKVPGASLDSSPPCFFEIYQRYISFSSLFDRVWGKDPTIFGCKARHNESLVLMLRCHQCEPGLRLEDNA